MAAGRADVEAFGQRRSVSVALMDAPPSPGDYVLVRAGGYATETVDPDRALEALSLFAADGLEAAFRRIERERMDDVPLLNRALRVEATRFEPWKGHWLGVLVSPWFVNLVLVRGAVEGWSEAGEGDAVMHDFPCGTLAFLAANEPEVGDFQTCALSTSMHELASQDVALEFARAALEAVMHPAASQAPAPARPSMSKRRFLSLGL